MRCAICKREQEKGKGFIRFWRTYTFYICGEEKCVDTSWIKIMAKLIKDGIVGEQI